MIAPEAPTARLIPAWNRRPSRLDHRDRRPVGYGSPVYGSSSLPGVLHFLRKRGPVSGRFCGNTASRELTLARIDALKPSLHAVVGIPREAAQQQAVAADEAWREANPRDASFEPLWLHRCAVGRKQGVAILRAARGGHSARGPVSDLW